MDVTQKLLESGLGWVVVVILAGVIVYQNKKLEALYKEKDSLQDQRRQDILGILDKYTEQMGDFSLTAKLLLSKLSGGDQ